VVASPGRPIEAVVTGAFLSGPAEDFADVFEGSLALPADLAAGVAAEAPVVAGFVAAGLAAAGLAAGFAGSVFAAASTGGGLELGEAIAAPAISSNAGAATALPATASHAAKRGERVSGMSLSLFDGGWDQPDGQGYSTQG
jgi:hypothetical protein